MAEAPLTPETFDNLPDDLQDALGFVAINQDGWAQQMKGGKTALRKLERRGLIESYEDQVYGVGDAPIDRIPVTVKRYRVPLHVHIVWAQWCSTKVDEGMN